VFTTDLPMVDIVNSPFSSYLIRSIVKSLFVVDTAADLTNSRIALVFSNNKDPNIINYTPEYEIPIRD
jgi:hypothetical protein